MIPGMVDINEVKQRKAAEEAKYADKFNTDSFSAVEGDA